MSLHLGAILPNYGPALVAEELAGAAVAAEEAGFDSAWVTDHLIVPDENAGVYGTIAEALVSLGFLAARTRRLELGVSALVVPQRNPLVALKQLISLDFLSGGRVITAVTAGWMKAEFAAVGAAYEERGRLLDEWLDLAESAFRQMPGRVRYEGRTLSVDGRPPRKEPLFECAARPFTQPNRLANDLTARHRPPSIPSSRGAQLKTMNNPPVWAVPSSDETRRWRISPLSTRSRLGGRPLGGAAPLLRAA